MKIDTETETRKTYHLTLNGDELLTLGVAARTFPDDRRELMEEGTGRYPLLPKFDQLMRSLGSEIRKELETGTRPFLFASVWESGSDTDPTVIR